MAKGAHPFLMFTGKAEEAMTFYTSLFEDGKIVSITRYGSEAPGREGAVTHAVFQIAGLHVMCIDSPPVHAFTFTPSSSLFITCDTEAEIDKLYAALSKDGTPLMPLSRDYGFARKYGWVNDRFGVSWQLNLP